MAVVVDGSDDGDGDDERADRADGAVEDARSRRRVLGGRRRMEGILRVWLDLSVAVCWSSTKNNSEGVAVVVVADT